ncbi:uncharacterized protein LOC142226257 [Haematobia irritans]|uniref:uncharacterized protein LOC142226257 n=1 Tax=Haematobia irritans TaxID=7368 RepID=UPI003F4FAD0A
MKVQQCFNSRFHATCCLLMVLLISIAATSTYATSPSPHEAEVIVPQTIATIPVKFGEKVGPSEIFLPTPLAPLPSRQRGSKIKEKVEQNEVFLPTPLTATERGSDRQGRRESNRDRSHTTRSQNNNLNNHRSSVPSSEQMGQSPRRQSTNRRDSSQHSSSRSDHFLPTPLTEDKRRSASEYITLPTHKPPQNSSPSSHLSRRHNTAGSDHNLVQPYDIPAVQKTHQSKPQKPRDPTQGGQRQFASQPQPPTSQANGNRSRFSHLDIEEESALQPLSRSQATIATQRQHQKATTANATTKQSNTSRTNSQHTALPPSSRNANHNGSSNSSTRNRNDSHRPNNRPQENSLQKASATAPGQSSPTKTKAPLNTGQVKQKSTSSVNQHGSRNNSRKSKPTTTTPRPFFSLPSEYNIFSPDFWSFLNPTSRNRTPPEPKSTTTRTAITTTKKPPKKYNPPQQQPISLRKEEKISYQTKIKTTEPPTTTTPIPEPKDTTIPPKRRDEGPFRIALPTFNILNSRRENNTPTGEKDKRDAEEDEDDLRAKFNCPRESEVRFQLFPKICSIDDDCKVWNRGEICCEIFGAKSCVSGIPKPLEETSHSPILGVIQRKCPSRPLAELWWEVKECETDMDCWPRVCCPDGRSRYCRTSQPELDTIPVPVQRSFNYLSEYLECTAPPPPIFDLHPKACTSTLDCFPNVCCQEAGLRHCRPPKKSVLTMLANVFNVDLVKRLTQNIVIK